VCLSKKTLDCWFVHRLAQYVCSQSAQKMTATLLGLHARPCTMFAVTIDAFHFQPFLRTGAMHFGAHILQCPDYSLNVAQAAPQPPVILIPQPWQALQPGTPFPPPHTPHLPHSGPHPKDQVLCDLVYLFNNVLRCYAPAVGHEIAHQPSVVTDHTGQLVFAQTAAGVFGTVAEATPNQVSEVWVRWFVPHKCIGLFITKPIGFFYHSCN